MTRGMPVPRSLVFLMVTGEAVVDWGDGRVQDIMSGGFMTYSESNYSRPLTDVELQTLKNNGRVEDYDDRMVYLRPLPEPPRKTIE
jgi:hypothetical protein